MRRGPLHEVIQPHKGGRPSLDTGSDLVDLPHSSHILRTITAIKTIEDGHRICNANTVAPDFQSAGAGSQLFVSAAQPRNDVEKANISDQEVIEVLDCGWPRLPRVVPFERGTIRPLGSMQGDPMNVNSKVRYRLQVFLIESGSDVQITGDESRSVGDEN